jgi:hypothetical protein
LILGLKKEYIGKAGEDKIMKTVSYQLSFESLSPVNEAIKVLETASNIDERGAIFTRAEVVDFILDLSGYTADSPLFKLKLLEPSVGEGDFLLRALKRLVSSWKSTCAKPSIALLRNSVRAVELHIETIEKTKTTVFEFLRSEDISASDCDDLIRHWFVQGDFLLTNLNLKFDLIIGNPPYVRQELIPAALVNEYRLLYSSFYDRADLYVPFIEKSLGLLSDNGNLAFICSDRWMKNRYGGPLRKIISEHYQLKYYVDMVDTPAFHSEVSAYPAITIFSRSKSTVTRIAHRPRIDKAELFELATLFKTAELPASQNIVKEVMGIAHDDEPWILESSDQLNLVRKLEARLPTLEDAGCKVGIGVATGADSVFIGRYDHLNVEADRKVSLVTTKDISKGSVEWRGLGVINPFLESGKLVDLDTYPLLKAYFEERKELIQKRHVASKNPTGWYRTIDRIYPTLTKRKKLLIPDIKGEANIVYEDGNLYPHHNLYYIISDSWDLRALQAVLLSGIARLFVSVYSTKMRGGYLRFQAQYLRRIRIPHWNDVPEKIKRDLIDAVEAHDLQACNRTVFKLYNLTKAEQEAIGGNGD